MSILRILCFLLMFFSIAQPAIVFPSTGNLRVFFILSIIALVVFLLIKNSTNEKSVKLPQNKFIYGIIITYTLSTAQFMYLTAAIDTFLFWFKKALLFYLIVNTVQKDKDLKNLIWAIVLAVTIQSLLGWDLYLNSPYLLRNEGRLQAFGNYNLSNSFAFLLTLTWPLAFSLIEIEKNKLKKLLLLALLIFFPISCAYTKSRGGSLGMIVGILLCVLFSRRLFKKRNIKIIISGLIVTVFLAYGMTVILSRSDITGFSGSDSSAGDRLLAWKAAIKMAKDHPLFGVGWGLFSENIRSYGHDKKIIAHNTLLSVLAETGIFGFFFLIAILFTNFKQLKNMRQFWHDMEDRNDTYAICQGVLISLICFVINTSFSVKDHDPMYWAVLSLAGALCALYIQDRVTVSKMS